MAENKPPEVDAVRLTVLEAYRRHAGELSRLAMALTRNRSLAEDILQETFLRYFLTCMQGEAVPDEGEWLSAVMRGLISDWKRAATLDPEVTLEDAASAPAKEPEGEALGSKALPWTSKAARILAPREQECIQLRAQGLEYKEIASAMRIDIGTVGTLLNRAVRKLKNVLASKEKLA